jgi:PAS domain S-box-containing protein
MNAAAAQPMPSGPAAADGFDALDLTKALDEHAIVAVTDARGRILRVNDKFCAISKYAREELLGKDHRIINSREHSPEFFKNLWETIARGRVWKGEICNRAKDGSLYWVDTTIVPFLGPDGKPQRYVAIRADITERKRAEQSQRAFEAHLAQTRKLEAIGTLAGGVAHEFNNQLASILGNLQLAELDLPGDSPVHRYLEGAIDASRRARDLVARMLTFSQSAEGQRVPTRLEGIVTEIQPLLRAILPSTVEILLRLDARCPAVRCSSGEINVAIVQLCTNAAHAMRERGGRLEISLGHAVPAPAFRDRHPQVGADQTVCLAVRDTGTGMSPATLARIFEPFFTTRLPGDGAGLGLAGVYGIMKRHHGSVAVESEPGSGTTVRLFFREEPAPADAVPSLGQGRDNRSPDEISG